MTGVCVLRRGRCTVYVSEDVRIYLVTSDRCMLNKTWEDCVC